MGERRKLGETDWLTLFWCESMSDSFSLSSFLLFSLFFSPFFRKLSVSFSFSLVNMKRRSAGHILPPSLPSSSLFLLPIIHSAYRLEWPVFQHFHPFVHLSVESRGESILLVSLPYFFLLFLSFSFSFFLSRISSPITLFVFHCVCVSVFVWIRKERKKFFVLHLNLTQSLFPSSPPHFFLLANFINRPSNHSLVILYMRFSFLSIESIPLLPVTLSLSLSLSRRVFPTIKIQRQFISSLVLFSSTLP